jgi:hypothetical protein
LRDRQRDRQEGAALGLAEAKADVAEAKVSVAESKVTLVLCTVDHEHEVARREAAEACAKCEGMVPIWPLPREEKITVAALPVMRRLQVRGDH